MGTIANLNYTSTHEGVAKYKDQLVPHSSSRPDHVQLVKTDKNYFYISIALFVLFLCLISVAFFLWCCGVRPRTLRRSGPVQSDAETHPLSISTI